MPYAARLATCPTVLPKARQKVARARGPWATRGCMAHDARARVGANVRVGKRERRQPRRTQTVTPETSPMFHSPTKKIETPATRRQHGGNRNYRNLPPARTCGVLPCLVGPKAPEALGREARGTGRTDRPGNANPGRRRRGRGPRKGSIS
eukprot:14286630-Alexandrium_andersonii.AAC.1